MNMEKLKKYSIIYGHYGSGKTTIALNLAVQLAELGKKVTLVDLDIVNPYFRSSDYGELLGQKGISLIAPTFAGTTLDAPALPAEIYSVTSSDSDHVLFDVGGDDAGALAFGRFSKMIRETGAYQGIYILNRYRSFIADPADALQVLREIEAAARLEADCCINNSHLAGETDAETIRASLPYADAFAQLSGLPLLCTAVPEHLGEAFPEPNSAMLAVRAYVQPPW